ncbi:protein smoothened [Trichogramma pretiosum]|uniref:protein smoothened n=1 Tax=Trichogramma pretiosum TaxID=7493 RepID=UPI0006C9814B|nr:protein smoothened [Trichogramma pretiosum]
MTMWLFFIIFLFTLTSPVKLELDHIDPTSNNGEANSWTELGPRLDRYPVGDLPSNHVHCKKPAKCVRINNATCMGTGLPYDTTTLDLIPEFTTYDIIKEKLFVLQALKHIPKCWTVVQPFLCSLFMPKCVNDTVDLPSYEMCKIVSGPCRILFNHTIWPDFVRCDDTKLFPRMCKNDFHGVKFNTTSSCLSPLVPTDNIDAVFEGVEGCGMPCSDPLYDKDEQKQIKFFVSLAASICGGLNLFTIITFFLNWRSSNKYPALVVFWINCCFFIFCIGWLLQFLPGVRENIVCKKDNTLRMGEPSGLELCVIVFVMVYYFSMAAMVWFVILSYTWYMRFQAIGKIEDRIHKKGAYFHLLAWCLPLMLTVTVMALGEIDGNYVTGICFVGYNNHAVRTWFVLVPVIIALLIGTYFLFRGLITLICIKIKSQEVLSEKYSSKIRQTIVRVGLVAVFKILAVVITVYCHFYDFDHTLEWKQSFREYMMCSITTKYIDIAECKMKAKPSIAKLQLHLFAPFFAGVLMSSWVWTRSTVDTWGRFFIRIFKDKSKEPIRLQKHKVIAQAFAKRKMFNNAGRLSISFHNSHEDPVGLNFDFNSAASQDFSSTWAAALPKLVHRRGALVGASVSSNRRNSTDSQYSFSLRRVSIESRRNSCDSQFALSISEVKAELKTSRVNKNRNGKRRKKNHERGRKRSEIYKRNKRELDKTRTGKTSIMPSFRRGSTTSQESQLGIQILQALSIGTTTTTTVPLPNLKRRVGLNEGQLAIKDVERLLPFLLPRHSDSEDNLNSQGANNQLACEVTENGCIDNVEAISEIAQQQTCDNQPDSEDEEDSQSEEHRKMMKPEMCERSWSKISNRGCRSNRRTSAESQTKYTIEDETVLKHLLHNNAETNDVNNDEEIESNNGDIDLSRSYSDLKNQRRLVDQSSFKAREMATQTMPFEIIEMEALKKSIDDIINSRNFSMKNMSLKKNKKQPK